MKELKLTLAGRRNNDELLVKLDDKPVKPKLNGSGNLTCDYQTENDSVNVKVYRLIDVGGPLWFITQLFFFIIGIFGLFGIHRKERCFAIDFEADVELRDANAVTLSFDRASDGARAVEIATELPVRELKNSYFIDAKAKKTYKALKIVKVFLALGIVAAAIAVIVTSIIL